MQQVYRFVFALRTEGGIVADADIFHPNEDWTRWGPQQVESSDFVLIIASPAWRDAWIGSGDPTRNKGVRAEASAVRSIEAQGHDVLQERVRLIQLPGSADSDIPTGLHGIARYRLDGFELPDLEPLLRDLTDQPMFVKPPIGDVPVFPPAMTTHTPDVATLETETESLALATTAADDSERALRVQQLKDQLDALPEPLPGDGVHLPWVRARQQIEARLFTELRALTKVDDVQPSPASAVAGGGVTWLPVSNVDLRWVDQWQPGMRHQSSAVVLHLIPVPQMLVSQRVMSSLDGTRSDLIYQAGMLELGQGFSKSFAGDDVVIELEVPRHSYGEVDLGQLLGCRVGRSGQVSLWFSLPRDGMGSVLDDGRLTTDLQKGLGLGGQILTVIQANGLDRIAVAAELTNLTLLTNGTLDQLGRRSAASMPGPFGRVTPRMKPDEAVDSEALTSPLSKQVAAAIARVIVSDWRGQR